MALLAGGSLLTAGGVANAVGSGGEAFSAWVASTPALLANAARLVGALLLLWGMAATHLRQAERVGWFGLMAFLLAGTNIVVNAAWMFSDLFIAPTFAAVAPQVLDGHGSAPGRIGAGMGLAWVTNVGFVLFGVTLLRARVLPRSTGILVLLAGVVFFVPMPFDGGIYEALAGGCCAVAGGVAVVAGRVPVGAHDRTGRTVTPPELASP